MIRKTRSVIEWKTLTVDAQKVQGEIMAMTLNWIKCQGEVWCKLSTVNLDHAHFETMNGVYIIWHAGANAATVYVGQGFVRDRLKQHRGDPRIQQYENLGLFVTWAPVPQASRAGVERYLANKLNPGVRDIHPDTVPIEVNLPW